MVSCDIAILNLKTAWKQKDDTPLRRKFHDSTLIGDDLIKELMDFEDGKITIKWLIQKPGELVVVPPQLIHVVKPVKYSKF